MGCKKPSQVDSYALMNYFCSVLLGIMRSELFCIYFGEDQFGRCVISPSADSSLRNCGLNFYHCDTYGFKLT